MSADHVAERPRTLADLYGERDLTPAQVRRIVTLLGLAAPQRTEARDRDEAA